MMKRWIVYSIMACIQVFPVTVAAHKNAFEQ